MVCKAVHSGPPAVERKLKRGLEEVAEKLDQDRLCNKGTASAGPQTADNKEWTLQAAEKLKRGQALCQGTTSVVPQTADNKGWALAPEGCVSVDSPEINPFFAACEVTPCYKTCPMRGAGLGVSALENGSNR